MSSNSSSFSLTSHLLALDAPALRKATTHPFLAAAATGTLPTPLLQRWLAQDRLYALSYTNFIGALLAHLPIPSGPDRETALPWRVADALIDALANIRRELKLFEDVARGEGWAGDVLTGVRPERVTRCYEDLFAGATAGGRGALVGLVVLWATEECYLRAWRFARGRMVDGGTGEEGDVMRRVFVPNWSSEEFEGFVATLRGLVDEMFLGARVAEGGWLWAECEDAWRQVVWLEGEFWPDVDADGTGNVS